MDATGQMTIFDFLPQPEDDLETLPETTMVRLISEATGLKFKPVDYKSKYYIPNTQEYVAKISKHEEYTIQYDNYLGINDNRRFIGTGYSYKTSGGSAPCDSVQEAINWFKKVFVTVAKEKVRMKEDAKKEAEYRKKYNLDY